jgi:hypothetical protein
MGTFSLGLDAFIAKAKANADTVVRQASLSVLSSVVKRSPVDTGRFRGNWQTTIDAPASGDVSLLDKSGAASISAGVGALTNVKAGETVWIVNNLPYAQRLENGYSDQAPAGMVRVTVTEFQRYVAQAASQVDK